MQNKFFTKIFLFLLCINFNYVKSEQNLKTSNLISFNFKQKKLIDIIDELALKKSINIIYPQNENDLEEFKKQEISYEPINQDKISIDEAWNLVTFFLELSGFSWFSNQKEFWNIIATGKKDEQSISREVLPIYIGTLPDNLPNNELRIRYVYYFTNLKIKDPNKNPISQIIKDMSSNGSTDPVFLTQKNGLIITDKSNVVSSIINLLSKLEEFGFQETIEIIPLYYLSAQEVVSKFNLLKQALGKPQDIIRNDTSATDLTYFSLDTKIIADNKRNSIILMGPQNATYRISKFIKDYIDVSIESGKSILHVYDLQYLNAKEFAPILQNIVSIKSADNQATQKITAGPMKFFNGVIVKSEEQIELQTSAAKEGPNKIKQDIQAALLKDSNIQTVGIQANSFIGGNRLVIAAMQDDWIYIKDLIKKMDKPKRQAIIEIVVVDFVYNKLDLIAGTTRNPSGLNPSGVQFLASHISPLSSVTNPNPSIDILGPDPKQLAQDLLALVGASSLPSVLPSGSVLFSFNDPTNNSGIFALLQILSQFVKSNIRTHPYIITLDNQKGTMTQTIVKRFNGDIVPAENGSFIINVEEITSTINLAVIPHIASDESVKLDIGIRIEDFIGNTLNKITRGLATTSILKNKQILAMGGLIREDKAEFNTYTPILGSIPIIGNFFKKNQYEIIKTNIVIFASVNILNPRHKNNAANFTEQKLELSQSIDIDLVNYRDPINRLIFSSDEEDKTNYIKDEFTQNIGNIKRINLSENNEFKKYNSFLFSNSKNKKLTNSVYALKEKLKNEENPILRFKA